MYFSSLQGHGTSTWPSASGAPTVWRQGNECPVTVTLRVAAALDFVFQALENLFTHLGHDAHVGHDIGRVRDFNADFGQGESRGPMQKGITYMVRPFMQPLKRPFSLAFISTGSAQWLVGPASSSFSLQMNVRSSTRATSEGWNGRGSTRGASRGSV